MQMEESLLVCDSLSLGLPPARIWRYRIEGSQKALFSLALLPGRPLQELPEPPPQALCVYTALRNPLLRHQNPYNPSEQVLFRRHLSHFILQPKPVLLSPSYLYQLALAADPFRPHSRCKQSSIATASGHAELLSDIALRFGTETILVEVKPKSGVLSRSALVHPDITTTLGKFHIPTYHLKNYILPDDLPEQLGQLPDPQLRYNPVELVSGINIRAQLSNLHNERSRSLRIFCGGHLLSHSSPGHQCNEGICCMALDAASRALEGGQPLRKSCLPGLREIQNMDYIDNIGAAFLLDRLVNLVGKPQAHEMIASYLYCDEDAKEDEESKLQFRAAKKIISYETSSDAALLHSEERYEVAVQRALEFKPCFLAKILADFLQAAAAKDCSIMVALCRREDAAFEPRNMQTDGECRVMISGGEEWLSSMHVVDTREKSIDKISHKWAAVDFKRMTRIEAAGGLSHNYADY